MSMRAIHDKFYGQYSDLPFFIFTKTERCYAKKGVMSVVVVVVPEDFP